MFSFSNSLWTGSSKWAGENLKHAGMSVWILRVTAAGLRLAETMRGRAQRKVGLNEHAVTAPTVRDRCDASPVVTVTGRWWRQGGWREQSEGVCEYTGFHLACSVSTCVRVPVSALLTVVFRATLNPGTAPCPEPAYSLYSTDSEDQVMKADRSRSAYIMFVQNADHLWRHVKLTLLLWVLRIYSLGCVAVLNINSVI